MNLNPVCNFAPTFFEIPHQATSSLKVQKDPLLLFNQAVELKNNGHSEEAKEKFFLAANQGNAEAYYELGLLLEIYNSSYESLNPCDCYNKAAYIYLDKGNFSKALQNYEKVLSIEMAQGTIPTNYATALNNTGKCHNFLGASLKAIAMHNEAASIFTNPEDLAITLNYLGKAQLSHGSSEEALISLTSALEKGGSNPAIKAETLALIGEVKQEQGEFDESNNYLTESLKIHQSLYNEPHIAIADSLYFLGCLHIHLNRLDEALTFNIDALKMKQILLGSDPHPSVADSLHNTGSVLEGLGRFDEALGYFKDALKMDKSVRGENAEHSDIAISLGHVGNILEKLGHFEEAKEYHIQSLAMSEKINYTRGIAQSNMDLGDLSIDLGLFKEAIYHYTQALEMRRKIHGATSNHPSIATSLNNLANAYMAMDQIDDAFQFYQQSLEMEKKIYGENTNHASIAILLQHIGDIHSERGDFQKALEYYDQCLDMQKKVLQTENHPHIFEPLHKKGKILAQLGRYTEAHDCLELSLKIKKSFYNNPHYEISIGLNSLGNLLEKLGRYEEALKCYEEALSFDEKGVKTHHIVRSLQNLSSCLGSLGSFEKALIKENEALTKAQKFYSEEHSKVAHSLRHIGICLYSLGNYDEALKNHKKALKFYTNIYGDEHPEVAITLGHIANIHAALQNFNEALSTQKEVHRILSSFYDPSHPILGNSLKCIASYLFSTDVPGALDKYNEAHSILEKKFGSTHPEAMLVSTCIDICSKTLKGPLIEKANEKTERLSPNDFKLLIGYAIEHLQNSKSLRIEKNPSGFVRIRIDISKEFHLADQIETIRLHYWPSMEQKIKIVEARHDHPRYFESMILNGGYTHHVYKKAECSSNTTESLRIHRIVKAPNSAERTIFCLGTMNLEDAGIQKTEKNMVLCFPKNLVHQVENYESATLTINAVFKGEQDLTYFDIFMPEGNHLDPQRERDFLPEEESLIVIPEIRTLLKNWES